MKNWLYILLLFPFFVKAQTSVTVIPGSLRVKQVPHTVSGTDSTAIFDINNNLKKGVITALTPNALTVNNSGAGDASSFIFNGAVPRTLSYNSIGANPLLISGTNIKTVNGSSLLGSGNLSVGTVTGANSGVSLSGNNIQLGGSALLGNSTINLGGFNLIFNQPTSGNILELTNNTTGIVAQFGFNGQLFAPGISNTLTGNNSQVSTSTTGIYINRNINDSHPTLTVENFNSASTADIFRVAGASSSVWLGIGSNGLMTTQGYATSSSTLARAKLFNDVLQPTANNDTEVGLDLIPVFGTSIIATTNTLVGGSGYGTSTYNVMLTGGTGSGATATLTSNAGAIVSVSLLNKGVNYTPGDVLSATVTDQQGNVIGTGFSINVATVTSYTGITKYALRTYGLDQYDSDYSSTYTTRSKPDKNYVDTHTAGVSLSTVTSGLQLAPKMTTTQKNAITGQNEADVVYDITLHEYDYWNGSAWVTL